MLQYISYSSFYNNFSVLETVKSVKFTINMAHVHATCWSCK